MVVLISLRQTGENSPVQRSAVPFICMASDYHSLDFTDEFCAEEIEVEVTSIAVTVSCSPGTIHVAEVIKLGRCIDSRSEWHLDLSGDVLHSHHGKSDGCYDGDHLPAKRIDEGERQDEEVERYSLFEVDAEDDGEGCLPNRR